MKLEFKKDQLLEPLLKVTSVVERRQTLPILSNVLLVLNQGSITFTATDLEVEVSTTVELDSAASGSITLPARKLLEICRALPPGADIKIDIGEKQTTVRSGRSRFTLASMDATEFPNIGVFDSNLDVTVTAGPFKDLIAKTQFAMAHQDVRYYLNGLLVEFAPDCVRTVATDGHRLAMSEMQQKTDSSELLSIIVPRKGIAELTRLLGDDDAQVQLRVGDNHLQAIMGRQLLTTKLIDGRFPDYEQVLPKGGDKIVTADRESLKQGFARASILSNEKFRGIRVSLQPNLMKALAHNPDQEEAEEEMEVAYAGEALEIGFNVSYLLDVFNNSKSESLQLEFSDSNSSCLIKPLEEAGCQYVVMPMRL